MKRAFLALAMTVALCGCTKTFVINTDPQGADISINGEYLGKSPLKAETLCTTFGDRVSVQISMDGYRDVNIKPVQYEANVRNIVADLFFALPAVFLNSYCPKDDYLFRLQAKR